MMRQLEPGLYEDGEGGLHLDVAELFRANGVEDTWANRLLFVDVVRQRLDGEIPVVVTTAPVQKDQ